MELITCSARAEITFPRVVNDLLIFAPSWNTQINLVTLNQVQSTVRWLKHCTCQKRSQCLMDLDKTTFLFSRQPESPQMNCPTLILVGCPIEKIMSCHAYLESLPLSTCCICPLTASEIHQTQLTDLHEKGVKHFTWHKLDTSCMFWVATVPVQIVTTSILCTLADERSDKESCLLKYRSMASDLS